MRTQSGLLQKTRRRCRPQIEVLEKRDLLSAAIFTVNTLADTVAVDLITGADSGGLVSLRSAIQAANNLGGSNTINLPVGTYTLALPGAGEDNAASGDLDIKNSLSISGAGAATTIIDANSIDRVLQVFSGFVVSIAGVTITGGQAAQGGGIFNAGTLTLTQDIVTINSALGSNGSVGGPGADAQGGGIYNDASASLTLTNATLSNNKAQGGAGSPGTAGAAGANGAAGGPSAAGDAGGPGSPGTNGTAAGSGFGGALYNLGTATIAMSTFTGDQAIGGQGGAGGNGGNGGNGGAGGASSANNGGTGGNGGVGASGGIGSAGGQAAGGAIYSTAGSVIIDRTTFASNSAIAGFAGRGGLGGNGGPGGSGGIGIGDEFELSIGSDGGNGGNGASAGLGGSGGSAKGGAIYASGGTLVLTGTTIVGSQAMGAIFPSGVLGGSGGQGGNGGIVVGGIPGVGGNGGNGGNSTGTGPGGSFGGALYNASGSVSIANSTLYGNEAQSSSGAQQTISPGASGGFGGSGGNGFGASGSAGFPLFGTGGGGFAGGVYVAGGTASVKNTIIAGSIGAFVPSYVTGTFTSLGHNLSGTSGSSGFGAASGDLIGVDPQLGPLQDNGGPTPTMAPLVSSPLIDAGNNSGTPATDQRGRPRLLDGKGIGFPLMDIGAVEYEPADVGVSGSVTPHPVTPGNPLTYDLTVTAGGDSNAGTVILTIPLPAHTTFQSFITPAGWAIFTPPVGAGGTVKAYLASLARGTSAAFALSLLVDGSAPGGSLATTASVTISSSDPNLANNSATLSTSVDAPVTGGESSTANGDVASVPEDGSVPIAVLVNDTGIGLLITAVSTPFHGTVLHNSTSITYTPAADFSGIDSFTYTITDAASATTTATVIVAVNPVNDAPVVAVPGPQTYFANTNTVIAGISVGDLDVNQGTGLVQVVVSALHGTVSPPSTAGLWSVTGIGTASMAILGPMASVTTALTGLIYRGNVNFGGNDTLTITADDQGNFGSGGVLSDTKTVTLAPVSNLVRMQAGAAQPGKKDLVIYGTAGNDIVSVLLTGTSTTKMTVKLNGGVKGKGFVPTGSILVFGEEGNDKVTISTRIKKPALLDGGAGNDTLTGGGGNDIALGGNGDDQLFGNTGRNLLIGGIGADVITGGVKDDILIAAATTIDSDGAALLAVLNAWNSADTYATRIIKISAAPLFLLTAATVSDDSDADVLSGSLGLDWFWRDLARDSITDSNVGGTETVSSI